ncbi:pentatricopeptide repeat-containing protein At5g04780, mitochondrial isoform X1 [Prosopis cineraria]|uniref:pentatricopeptide repeat-containing protein At5g04780, mitochondrial isoform X1 n=1 Tax=Prosopis cineraria TaxID=364024 RepID=UPI0024106CE7|nr:pentatricopeptide repeat-containing protein At5g04780, mitochondrial isoform X1 [Prosopis cineraria]
MKSFGRFKRFCDSFGFRLHSRQLSVIPEAKPEILKVKEEVHVDADVARISTLHYLIQLCAKTQSLMEGSSCHAQTIRIGFEIDILTSNMLINMYSKCGLVDNAFRKFNEMPEKSLVSWNTMIGSLTQNGEEQEALTLFIKMQRNGTSRNEFSISSVLCACSTTCAIVECMQLHAFAIKASIDSNVFVGTALIDVYAKCSSIKDANQVFQSMPKRSPVTWSSMVAGYVLNGLYEEALLLFHSSQLMGLEPDQFMVSSAISACAGLSTLIEGKQVHAMSCKSGFDSNLYVVGSLIDMYAKCGCIKEAYLVFQCVEKRSIVLWNAMISGFARHACALEAMILFEKLQQIGFCPDDVTYLSVLNSCSHMGLHEEGQKYLNLMVRQHNRSPNVIHYSCMVDILSRAGLVHEAYELMERMPFNATTSMWGSLLASCRKCGNIELAEVAAKHLFEMEPNNAGNHILLSNIYAANKQWEEVARARKLLRESDLKKERGKSWIEIKNEVHSFTAGDRNHPKIDRIYEYLDNLIEELKEVGYKVETNYDLHDLEEGTKQVLLRHHSEKLALTLGLMCLPCDVPIRIMKNLRICGDCHTFMKLASKFANREIIIRDINRFHHLKDGICSCGDFW